MRVPALALAMLMPAMTLAGVDDKDFGSVTVTEVTSIYDADTFRANIEGWPAIIGERISVRVAGVDAPEIKAKCDAEKTAARAAKEFTAQELRSAKTIELRHIRRDKYFRVLADVMVDGRSLGQALVDAGHARPYDGGTKRGWCPIQDTKPSRALATP